MGELVDRDQDHLHLLKFSYYIMLGRPAVHALFQTPR